jgi:hypothetical protein
MPQEDVSNEVIRDIYAGVPEDGIDRIESEDDDTDEDETEDDTE